MRQTLHPFRARLSLEPLEDRTTPSGTQVPAGEYNWTQVSPSGQLAQLVWSGSALVYQVRSGSGWTAETVATENGTYTAPQYDTRLQVERASRSAQLVYASDGTAHAFYLAEQWVPSANGYRSEIVHMERIGGNWKLAETISAPWVSVWGPVDLVAAAGPKDSISLLFSETYNPVVGPGNEGTGKLWYASNRSGGWAFDKVADTADPRVDAWFAGDRYAPRYLSLAVDSQGSAHVTYTPILYVQAAFSTTYSELWYATNQGGAWQSQLVFAPPDGTGDAALGASVAVGPGGQVAIAGYYVDRATTASPLTSQLQYYTPNGKGGWTAQVVVNVDDGYAAADGTHFTGFSPQLFFAASGQVNVVFEDVAAQHLAVTHANEMAGQIRLATLTGNAWSLSTVYRQSNPLVNQLYYPVAVTYKGQLAYAALSATDALDANQNVAATSYALIGVNLPTVPPVSPPPPPVSPVSPPAPPVSPVSPPVSPPVHVSPPPVSPPPVSPPPPVPPVSPPVHVSPPPVSPPPVSPPVSPSPVSPPPLSPPVTLTPPPVSPPVHVSPPAPVSPPSVSTLVHVSLPPPASPPPPVSPPPAVAADLVAISGGGGVVQAFKQGSDGLLHPVSAALHPFAGYDGEIRTAVGDFNGDGVEDLAVAAAAGPAAEVAIYSGKDFSPLLGPTGVLGGFAGGAFLAAGDILGNGRDQLVVSADAGGSPRVTGYSYANGELAAFVDFYAFDAPTFAGGARIAVGDVNRDGFADLAVTAGPGGGPRVSTYDGRSLAVGGTGKLFNDFYAYDPNLRTGAFVAVGDVDRDGYADIVFSADVGGSSRTIAYSGYTLTAHPGIDPMTLPFLFSQYATPENLPLGTRVTIKDLNGDGRAELIFTTAARTDSSLRTVTSAQILSGSPPTNESQWPIGDAPDAAGIYVG